MPETPEQKARRKINADLVAAGWLVQNRDELDLTAGRGIAVQEFPMKSGFGFVDYLLYLDRKAIGAVEAKAEGTLTGVESQSAKYAAGLPDNLPAHRRPLPFLFESNGSVTYFTNGLDPIPRSRQVFNFPRPETLAGLVAQPAQLRARLKQLPPLDETGLWKVQTRAIRNLEESFADADPRSLIQMATGSGKTFTAVNVCYRLLKFASAKRILFLVDRGNLGKQTEDEVANFEPPDDPRKFPQLYTVQRLKSNSINPAAKVVITTIQRLFSMLKGETEFDPENEEGSSFDTAKPWRGEPPEMVYNPGIPPEFFDFVIVDIIVDAVGVCEQDKTDSHTLNRKPSATLPELLEYVAQGGTDPEALETLAGRLARLQREFTTAQLTELQELAGGQSFPDLAHALLQACDPDAQIAAAKQLPGATEPLMQAHIEQATELLAQQAVTPFLKAAFRRRILEIRAANEQTIDRHNLDEVLYAGFDAEALQKAQAKVKNFREWIEQNRNELTARQMLYAGPRPLRLSLQDLRQLRDALARPPLAATPTQIWRAFNALESAALAEAPAATARGGEQLADLVTLVRRALIPNISLVPYAHEVRERYVAWRHDQEIAGRTFTGEQNEWLDRIAEHIATSLSIESGDFEDGWFGQHGSLGKAHALFGEQLPILLRELNEAIAA